MNHEEPKKEPVPQLKEEAHNPLIEISSALPLTDPRIREFLRHYEIIVTVEGEVSVNLAGTTRLHFLEEVQTLGLQLTKAPVIHPGQLEDWREDGAFTAYIAPSDPAIEIKSTNAPQPQSDGNLVTFGAEFLESRPRSTIQLCDLAVAHAAYYIATGKDLFEGYVGRASNRFLYVSDQGLCEWF